MPPVTSQMLDIRREKDCVGITLERKYFHVNGSFVKRSLRPSEWQINPVAGTVCVPRFGNERLLNEAANMQFIASFERSLLFKSLSCLGNALTCGSEGELIGVRRVAGDFCGDGEEKDWMEETAADETQCFCWPNPKIGRAFWATDLPKEAKKGRRR
ncbi:unnamed protein product [Clonostachys rhizophaga]|uniref:Uncharacterized protein n=1 Tax=Clonostachys rhizophaga TaxID=160324 RepID=A0A9N9VGQ4_9HYPO|nr:unnamed protein product [Clonostachys rhizophaga]